MIEKYLFDKANIILVLLILVSLMATIHSLLSGEWADSLSEVAYAAMVCWVAELRSNLNGLEKGQ